MKYLSILALLALAACAGTPALQPLPAKVEVPVPVSCVNPQQIPKKPDYEAQGDNDQTPDGTMILHMARDLAKSKPYESQLEALIHACR